MYVLKFQEGLISAFLCCQWTFVRQ